MKIYTIVVAYNGLKWLNKCLGSLQESSQFTNVIVIDNNSSDESVSFVRENFPTVTLLALKDNLGFGRANNYGIKKAIEEGATHVFLLNQDAWVQKDTIGTLKSVAEESGNNGFLLSPMHLNGEGDLFDDSFYKYISKLEGRALYSDIFLDKKKSCYPVEFANAAAWFVPINLINTCGAFNPLFPHYGEDLDFCNRIQFFGKKIAVVPNAVIFHDREGRKSARSIKNEAKYVFITRLASYTNLNTLFFKTLTFFFFKDFASILLAFFQLDFRRIAIRTLIQFHTVKNIFLIYKYRMIGKDNPFSFIEEKNIFSKVIF